MPCPPGAQLPPSRALAADLGVARNSVADAYGQLVAEGWLTARTREAGGSRCRSRPELAQVFFIVLDLTLGRSDA